LRSALVVQRGGERIYPFNSQMAKVEVMKRSEMSWRCPNRGLTRVRMGTFRHRTPAKPALGGLLKPLFRLFHGEVHRTLQPVEKSL
jgi:hypothetical protein